MVLVSGVQFLVGSPGEANFAGRNGHLVVAIPLGDESEIRHLWSGLANGAEALQLTDGEVSDCCASYSASGQLIAFSRDADPTDVGRLQVEVWVMDADGTNERQLTTLNGVARDPQFSPIEPRVVFGFERIHGLQTDIYSIRLDGTGLRPLTSSSRASDYSPVFAPGGHRLLWVRNGDLWLMRPNGTHKRRIVHTRSGAVDSADWSPGGQRIAYYNWRRREITIVRPNGTLVRQIPQRRVGTDIAWSPNGRWIAFIQLGRRFSARAISADGKRTREIPRFWGDARFPAHNSIGWQPNPT